MKQAIHAPLDVNWEICAEKSVFAGGDNSDPSSYRAIPNVIDRTKNVQIAHGTMDMVLLANGTLLGIQNMTWGGQMGFQSEPRDPLFVPHHPNPDVAGSSGQGVLGTWHSERGLTWALVDLTGHMVPTWQAGVAFRQIEVLLGRVENLASTTAFPIYSNATQPDASQLGFGTAWYGFEDASSGISEPARATAGKSEYCLFLFSLAAYSTATRSFRRVFDELLTICLLSSFWLDVVDDAEGLFHRLHRQGHSL